MRTSGPGSDLETVIGLEIHVQLGTRTKLFCGCELRFGDPPNTHACPVCLGLPGALPVLNERAVELSLRVALALGCRVNPRSRFARKNYFYPDLPKGYQISQYDQPLGENGEFEFRRGDDTGRLHIVRVHLEEDAGKSVHGEDELGESSLIDLNRCGTPLIETVTAPDLRSPEEATDFLESLRTTLLYLGVTDASMEQGSLRCDANISVRPRDQAELNPKTELKNLNSFRFLRHALRHEETRQAEVLARGERLEQATRLWDERAGTTVPMRSKEHAHDYRYFPEPDLVPIVTDAGAEARARGSLPELPLARARRVSSTHGMSLSEAWQLVEDRARGDLFERAVAAGAPSSAASNWVRGVVQAWLNERGLGVEEFPVPPESLAELLMTIEDGTVSGTTAKDVLARMIATGDAPGRIIERDGLRQLGDETDLARVVEDVLAAHPEDVASFREGNAKVAGFLMGKIMRHTGGRANPETARRILLQRLEP